MSDTARGAAQQLVLSCEHGMSHGQCIQPYAVDPVTMAKWPRTHASLLLAWIAEREYETRLSAFKAKMHAEDEALRREAWEADAPVRETARELFP